MLLQFIKEQTPEICEAAVRNNPETFPVAVTFRALNEPAVARDVVKFPV
jgi:hypothetical protein